MAAYWQNDGQLWQVYRFSESAVHCCLIVLEEASQLIGEFKGRRGRGRRES